MTSSTAGRTTWLEASQVVHLRTRVLPAFRTKIARKYPDVRIHISSGNTSDIMRSLESGQINLGFIRPVENIGSLRFFSMAQTGDGTIAAEKAKAEGVHPTRPRSALSTRPSPSDRG